MVARDNREQGRSDGRRPLILNVLTQWQLLLTHIVEAARRTSHALVRWLRSVAVRISEHSRQLVAILAGSPRDTARLQPPLAAAVALATGILLSTLVGVAQGTAATATLNALVAALWVTARLLVMRVVAQKHGVGSTLATAAWAAGALPFAFAVWAPLRPVAWLLGVYLTNRALRRNEVPTAEARMVTAYGYGVEALGVAVVWLARNLVVAALLFR